LIDWRYLHVSKRHEQQQQQQQQLPAQMMRRPGADGCKLQRVGRTAIV